MTVMAELTGWPCLECGGQTEIDDDGLVMCIDPDCGWCEPAEVDDPFEFTVEGFRLFYWRPPGTPVAPHSYGPAIGVRPAELGPLGKELLGG